MAVLGLILFTVFLLQGIARVVGLKWERFAVAALMGVSALVFLPLTVAQSRLYERASEVVEGMRARIERETVSLPNGCAVRLEGVPQWEKPPYYFGWGLLSALKPPFTQSDLAGRCVVINHRNIALTRSKVKIPEHFDLVLDLNTPSRRAGRTTP